RRLYAPAGYPSMFAYCVGWLHLSEDAAYKRIRVARAARKFPGFMAALADGDVHLSGLTLLAQYSKRLTTTTAEELLVAATHKSKREIERLLAERFPKPDVQPEVRTIPPAAPTQQTALEAPEQPQAVGSSAGELAPGPVGEHVIL